VDEVREEEKHREAVEEELRPVHGATGARGGRTGAVDGGSPSRRYGWARAGGGTAARRVLGEGGGGASGHLRMREHEGVGWCGRWRI
jgi:hypothetical protein